MNSEKSFPFRISVVAAVISTLAVGGCVPPLELTSTPPKTPVTIDGNSSDWADALSYLEKEEVSLGIHDDGQHLSACLVTTNRFVQMQILSGGFTVWLDPKGGDNKQFGIRFPLRQSDHLPLMRGNEPLTDVVAAMASRLQEAEILGSRDEDAQRFSVLQIPGVKVRIGVAGEALVYEFQVSLMPVGGSPLDLHEARSGIIGIGFEALGRDADQLSGPSGRSAPAGRGRRSMPSGPSAIGGSERQDLLDFWTIVHLTKSST